ncbi:MAG TPA: tetratricopeptide repeat protein [Actinomycetota bacterium]|nr:tetratricopeptide repeat protein [Actinomycetota bacterium]
MADGTRGGRERPRRSGGPKDSRGRSRPGTSGQRSSSGGGRSSGRGAGGSARKPAGPASRSAAGRSDRAATGDRRERKPAGGRPERKPDADRPERDTSNDLPWPEEIFELELEPELLKELEAFGGRTETLAKHLLSVQVLAESDPEQAYLHAARLRERVPRSALARQTACIAAYRAAHYKEAVKDEAAYRRISGGFELVPIAADSERGLGRPERALAMVAEFEAERLDSDTRTELLIVGGGARRDLGDDEAARVLFQKAVRAARSPMASARARFALGDMLSATGDAEQARKWLQSAIDLDEDAVWTEARSRLEELP